MLLWPLTLSPRGRVLIELYGRFASVNGGGTFGTCWETGFDRMLETPPRATCAPLILLRQTGDAQEFFYILVYVKIIRSILISNLWINSDV
jgi:hypothetical protein